MDKVALNSFFSGYRLATASIRNYLTDPRTASMPRKNGKPKKHIDTKIAPVK